MNEAGEGHSTGRYTLEALCEYFSVSMHRFDPYNSHEFWYSLFNFKTFNLLTVTSVDLWSDIIAMDYPSPHILRLYIALFRIKRQYTLNV